MWIKNITKHNYVIGFYKLNMTDLQIGNSFCEFGLVSTYQRFSAAFWPKSAPFWNSLLKIMAQLQRQKRIVYRVLTLYYNRITQEKNNDFSWKCPLKMWFFYVLLIECYLKRHYRAQTLILDTQGHLFVLRRFLQCIPKQSTKCYGRPQMFCK